MEIEVSADQNTVNIDGIATTFEAKKMNKYTCNKCWWVRNDKVDCNLIPCLAGERKDKKYGVFTIQNMPGYES